MSSKRGGGARNENLKKISPAPKKRINPKILNRNFVASIFKCYVYLPWTIGQYFIILDTLFRGRTLKSERGAETPWTTKKKKYFIKGDSGRTNMNN